MNNYLSILPIRGCNSQFLSDIDRNIQHFVLSDFKMGRKGLEDYLALVIARFVYVAQTRPPTLFRVLTDVADHHVCSFVGVGQ
jgi:hypothetical protein